MCLAKLLSHLPNKKPSCR